MHLSHILSKYLLEKNWYASTCPNLYSLDDHFRHNISHKMPLLMFVHPKTTKSIVKGFELLRPCAQWQKGFKNCIFKGAAKFKILGGPITTTKNKNHYRKITTLKNKNHYPKNKNHYSKNKIHYPKR